MITLTPEAAKKIKQQITRRGGLGLRLSVKTTGCSGLAYVLEYADVEQENDTKVECDGCVLYLDHRACPYLAGATLDYVRKGLNEGFEFINPNERDRCGCGESFRV